MIVVAGSSPLRYRIAMGLQRLLPELFGGVWMPGAVLRELSAAATPRAVSAVMLSGLPWLKLRDPAPDSVLAIDPALDFR